MKRSKAILVVTVCMFSMLSLLGCEDPASATIKAGMEAQTEVTKAKLQSDLENRKLDIEERKLDMQAEQAERDAKAAREAEENGDDPDTGSDGENAGDAAAEDSGVKDDNTGTGTSGTDVSNELSTK